MRDAIVIFAFSSFTPTSFIFFFLSSSLLSYGLFGFLIFLSLTYKTGGVFLVQFFYCLGFFTASSCFIASRIGLLNQPLRVPGTEIRTGCEVMGWFGVFFSVLCFGSFISPSLPPVFVPPFALLWLHQVFYHPCLPKLDA